MDERKWAWIVMRVPPEEKELLLSEAKSYHLNLSRYLVLMGLRGKVE